MRVAPQRQVKYLAIAILALVICAEAVACSCIARQSSHYFEDAGRVIVGTVTSTNEADLEKLGNRYVRKVVVQVDEVLKGEPARTLSVADGLSSCSLYLKKNDRVILFLQSDLLKTSKCNGSAVFYTHEVLKSRFNLDEQQIRTHHEVLRAHLEVARKLAPKKWWQLWR